MLRHYLVTISYITHKHPTDFTEACTACIVFGESVLQRQKSTQFVFNLRPSGKNFLNEETNFFIRFATF